MSRKHQSPEYRRNARTIRARCEHTWAQGGVVTCWRCGGAITSRAQLDVGHVRGAVGSALHELAPEHRHATDRCEGNRAAGGRRGAQLTNRTTVHNIPTTNATSWKV